MSTENVKPRMLLHLASKLNFIEKEQARKILKSPQEIEIQLSNLLNETQLYTVRLLFILKSILKISEHKNFISRVEYIHLLDCQFALAQKNVADVATAIGDKLSSPLLVRIVNFLVKSSILSAEDKDFILDIVAKKFSSVPRLPKTVDDIQLDREETISILRRTSPIPVVPQTKELVLKEYNIVKKITEEEFLALDENNQGIAMQLFSYDISMDLIKKFREKMKVLKTLHHKNIIAAYDFGFYPSYHQYALIKEFVDGTTVKQMVKKHSKLTEPLALKIAYYALSALRHAQTQNITHGNVRPDNIVITSDNKSAKLGGFCLDRIVNEQEMKSNDNDAYFYMSLEQIQSPEKIDQRSDIYNVGASLYFMLSGRPPYFECRNMYEIATAYIQNRKPAMLTGVSSEVAQIVNKAIEIDKKKRYQTLFAMQSDIKKLL